MIESVLLFSISTLKVILYSSYSFFGTDNLLKNALLLSFPPGSSVADISKLAVQVIDSIFLLTFMPAEFILQVWFLQVSVCQYCQQKACIIDFF